MVSPAHVPMVRCRLDGRTPLDATEALRYIPLAPLRASGRQERAIRSA